RRAAVEKITKVVAENIDPEVSNGAMAFAVIAGRQAEALANAKDPKLSDVEKLGRIMTGLNEEPRRANGEGDSPPAGMVTAAPAALLELLHMIEARKRAAAGQAQAIEGESDG